MAYIDLTFAGTYIAPTGNAVAFDFLWDINAKGTADIVASSSLSVVVISFADISAVSSLTATGLTSTNTAALNGVASLTAVAIPYNQASISAVSSLTATGLTSTNSAALNAVSVLQATGIVPIAPVEPSLFTVGTDLDIPNAFTTGTDFLLAAGDTVYATAYIVSTSILTAELQTDEDVGYANIRGTFRMDLPASGIYNIIWKDYVNTYAYVYY